MKDSKRGQGGKKDTQIQKARQKVIGWIKQAFPGPPTTIDWYSKPKTECPSGLSFDKVAYDNEGSLIINVLHFVDDEWLRNEVLPEIRKLELDPAFVLNAICTSLRDRNRGLQEYFRGTQVDNTVSTVVDEHLTNIVGIFETKAIEEARNQAIDWIKQAFPRHPTTIDRRPKPQAYFPSGLYERTVGQEQDIEVLFNPFVDREWLVTKVLPEIKALKLDPKAVVESIKRSLEYQQSSLLYDVQGVQKDLLVSDAVKRHIKEMLGNFEEVFTSFESKSNWLHAVKTNLEATWLFDAHMMPSTDDVVDGLANLTDMQEEEKPLLENSLKTIDFSKRVYMNALRSDDVDVRITLHDDNYRQVLRWAEAVLCDLPQTVDMTNSVNNALGTPKGITAYDSLDDEQKNIILAKLSRQKPSEPHPRAGHHNVSDKLKDEGAPASGQRTGRRRLHAKATAKHTRNAEKWHYKSSDVKSSRRRLSSSPQKLR